MYDWFSPLTPHNVFRAVVVCIPAVFYLNFPGMALGLRSTAEAQSHENPRRFHENLMKSG